MAGWHDRGQPRYLLKPATIGSTQPRRSIEFRTVERIHYETDTTKSSRRSGRSGRSGGASRCFELLSASRDASDGEAGSLPLMPDRFRNYALAASCAASNTSRADVLPSTYPRLRGPSIPRSRPQTCLRQVQCGPSECRTARTLPPTPDAGPQRPSPRDSELHPIAARLHRH